MKRTIQVEAAYLRAALVAAHGASTKNTFPTVRLELTGRGLDVIGTDGHLLVAVRVSHVGAEHPTEAWEAVTHRDEIRDVLAMLARIKAPGACVDVLPEDGGFRVTGPRSTILARPSEGRTAPQWRECIPRWHVDAYTDETSTSAPVAIDPALAGRAWTLASRAFPPSRAKRSTPDARSWAFQARGPLDPVLLVDAAGGGVIVVMPRRTDVLATHVAKSVDRFRYTVATATEDQAAE